MTNPEPITIYISTLRAGASDEDLSDRMKGIWSNRTDRYSQERTELAPSQNAPRKVEMYQIGG